MKLKPTPKIPLDRKCFFMNLSLLSNDTAKKTIFAGFSRISNRTSQSLAFVLGSNYESFKQILPLGINIKHCFYFPGKFWSTKM